MGGTPSSAEYVVVGAGIIGAAVAAHLARQGARPLVVEAGRPGGGATAASGGMVRAFDPDPTVAQLARASLRTYGDATAWASGVAPLRRTGAVTLAAPALQGEMEAVVRALVAAGDVGPRIVDGADEVLGVRTAGGLALVEPGGGWVHPGDVTTLFLRQAVRDGARLVTGVRVRAVRPAVGGVRLELPGTTLRARVVLLALGAWAARMPAGIRRVRRVRTRAIQISVLRRPAGAPGHAGFVDLRTGAYGKPIDVADSLVGSPLLSWDEDPWARPAPDRGHHRRTVDLVSRSLPWARRASVVGLARSCDGYADDRELLVPTTVDGVWSARAGSGSGVRVAPELGREIADQLVDQYATRDGAHV